jgi:hypothetical protein
MRISGNNFSFTGRFVFADKSFQSPEEGKRVLNGLALLTSTAKTGQDRVSISGQKDQISLCCDETDDLFYANKILDLYSGDTFHFTKESAVTGLKTHNIKFEKQKYFHGNEEPLYTAETEEQEV